MRSHAQTNGQVTGWIDGVFGTAGAQYIQGWACEYNNPNPLTVHLYTGGATRVGQIYSEYVANASAGDSGVSSACGTSTGHRFIINVTGDLYSRSGQSIFMYGIAQSGGPNNQLGNSGSYSIPTSTTLATVDSISASGYASGWAFDQSSPSASIQVAVYADGSPSQGAETGTLVWQGYANQSRPDVDTAYNITGAHGFSVQLPSSVTTGVHALSVYPLNVTGGIGSPAMGSPTVPGAQTLTSQFSFDTSAQGFPSQWYGYSLPSGSVNLVSLSGTISVNNTSSIYSEMLFIAGYVPSGPCPTSTTLQWGPPGITNIWGNIIKTPTEGISSVPVNFTLPVGMPVSNCLLFGINGGTVAPAPGHVVTGTINLVATYVQNPSYPTQEIGLGNEFCFGQNWGCTLATADDTKSFAVVNRISSQSNLNAITGNISDSTFDGSSAFGPTPTAPWVATNDVYLYHGSADCSQFPTTSQSTNGPGDYYSQIPSDATHLLSAPLSGDTGVGVGETINYLLPGLTNGIVVNQTFSGVTLNAGDCIVTLTGLQSGTNGAFDNEAQIQAFVTPF